MGRRRHRRQGACTRSSSATRSPTAKKWTLHAPRPRSAPRPRRPPADGKIVIGIKDGLTEKAKCTQLQMIDLKTGKAGWKKPIPKAAVPSTRSPTSPWRSAANTVAAAGTGNCVRLLDSRRQAALRQARRRLPAATPSPAAPSCIAAASCRTSGYDKPKTSSRSSTRPPARPSGRTGLPAGWEVDKVYSVSPLVVSLTQREPEEVVASSRSTTTARCARRSTAARTSSQPRCGGASSIFGQILEGCTGVAADAYTFYMATEPGRTAPPTRSSPSTSTPARPSGGARRRRAPDDAAAHGGRQRPRLPGAPVRRGRRGRHDRAGAAVRRR